MKKPSKKPGPAQLRRELAAVFAQLDRDEIEVLYGMVFGFVAATKPDRPKLIPKHFQAVLRKIRAYAKAPAGKKLGAAISTFADRVKANEGATWFAGKAVH